MFNPNNLPYTDQKSEMIEIGKSIAKEYDPKWLQEVHSVIYSIKSWDTATCKRNGGGWNYEEVFYKAIYDYWAYGFAPIEQSQYRLLDKTHEEKNSYLSMNSKFAYIARLNKKASMSLLEDKYEAYQFLKPYYKRDVIKIEGENDFQLFCSFVEKHPLFIAKPIGLYCAIGVRAVRASDYSSLKELFDSLIESIGDYEGTTDKWTKRHAVVLEEPIVQDKQYAEMHPRSVNGVRITTIRINGTVHIYYPWIKVGVADDVVASAAQGGFDAGIDVETGVLNTEGFLEDGTTIERHPVTGVKILGFQIPRWGEAVSMAREIALLLPTSINYVGWDFVLTPAGWIVMEGNFYGDPMWQMFLQKGMKEDFERLLNWKPEDKFWWKQNLRKIENW